MCWKKNPWNIPFIEYYSFPHIYKYPFIPVESVHSHNNEQHFPSHQRVRVTVFLEGFHWKNLLCSHLHTEYINPSAAHKPVRWNVHFKAPAWSMCAFRQDVCVWDMWCEDVLVVPRVPELPVCLAPFGLLLIGRVNFSLTSLSSYCVRANLSLIFWHFKNTPFLPLTWWNPGLGIFLGVFFGCKIWSLRFLITVKIERKGKAGEGWLSKVWTALRIMLLN